MAAPSPSAIRRYRGPQNTTNGTCGPRTREPHESNDLHQKLQDIIALSAVVDDWWSLIQGEQFRPP